MKNKRKTKVFFIPIIIVFSLFVLKFWAQECVENVGSFTESFADTVYKDPASSVDHWGDGYITLNKLGANFTVPDSLDFPTWINTVTANDFNGDGWPDLVGSSSSYSNVLVFIENMGDEGSVGTFAITQWIDGSTGPDGDGKPILGVQGQPLDTNGHCGLTSGDYDGDGDIDFMHFSGLPDSPNTPERIWLYENHLNEGSLFFTQTDMTSTWAADVGGIAWTATFTTTTDFDNDGDLDILSGNAEGEVIIFRNTGNGVINSSTFVLESTPILTTGWTGIGVSSLSIADLDMDGDDDILVGSVDYGELKYFKNDGSGNFILYAEYYDLDVSDEGPGSGDDLFDGASTVSVVADFDLDGDPDVMIGTDQWNYRAGEEIGGIAYFFRNTDGDLNSTLIFDERDFVFDFDMGEVFDYDQDGDMDFLMADGNHSEKYYLFRNDVAPVYNLIGTAISKNITPGLNPDLQAITEVQVKKLKQSVIGDNKGLRVELWVTNDSINWEFYDAWETTKIKERIDLEPHAFTHFGSTLKWKIVFTAEEDEMAEYDGASYDTPKVEELTFDYTYVDQREYSRTSVATTVLEGAEEKKLVIGGSFVFPGWKGYLRAYDLSEMALENTTYSVLKTVTRPDLTQPGQREIVDENVTIFWDAGNLLASRPAASRVIYTAHDEGSGLTRIDFTAANVATLAPILQDFNSDNAGLIGFVRGEGRSWKLGDINHSNPVAVGPPVGDSTLKGSGYDTFKETWKDRQKVLYAGANDGMIHCFDVLTGDELWAFIPYNLLPMLRDMWAVDEITRERVFLRRAYVDGSPVVEDVYIDADGDGDSEWTTLLVCGQGPGQGSTLAGGKSGNFYFALDVTNPADPKPLWEFTHDKMGETWSVPVMSRVQKDGLDTWAGFVGSGYDNVKGPGGQGNVIFAFDLEAGTLIWDKNTGDVDTGPTWGFNIKNTLPGSPSSIDTDTDGYVERVYFGDLDGRLWRVDVSANLVDPGSWSAETLYTDSNNYPILTKPALWINPLATDPVPHIYFGTGGDDYAPSDAFYSFIAFSDGTTPEVEWYIGDQATLGLPAEKDMGDFASGDKVWADPKVADYVVYFSTLQGSIESVNPCQDIAGAGKLFARYIQDVTGTAIGGTALKTESGSAENLELAIKTRAAVTLGERGRTEPEGTRKREIYIQEFDSTLQKLEQGTIAALKVKSFREIYRVVR
jgi:hypothetical protein